MKDRVIRDGLVAVVYSPGFGAGWSTWAHGEQGNELVFDPMIVDCVETKDFAKLATYMAVRYPDMYTCLLYTSPSPRDGLLSRMPSSA